MMSPEEAKQLVQLDTEEKSKDVQNEDNADDGVRFIDFFSLLEIF